MPLRPAEPGLSLEREEVVPRVDNQDSEVGPGSDHLIMHTGTFLALTGEAATYMVPS